MKKIIISFAALCAVLVIGCKKMVDEKPLSDGILEYFYKTKFDADAAMAGMYGEFQQVMVGDAQFKNRYTFWGEGRSDNFEKSGYASNSFNEMHFNSLTANNDFADWTGLYRIIGRANMNIAKFPEINKYAKPGSKEVVDAPTLNSYMAQCYAMRAVCYFYIVRVWGDAPIRTEPYLDSNQDAEQARDPKEKVLDQIVADLQKAYELSPKGVNANVWYLHEGAISATLADVYMWKKDYPNAIKWMQLLFKAKGAKGAVYNATGTGAIGSGGSASNLETTANWKNQFTAPTFSHETIWSIHWDYTNNGCPCMAAASTANNNTPYRIGLEIFTNWPKDTADVRAKATFDATKKEQDRMWKWYPGAFGSTGPKGNYAGTYGTTLNVYLPMYRLADQFLLYAEALNKTGDQANALKYLNLIRVRAGLTALTAADVPDEATMENAILRERQLELFGEGKRWFDLVRTGKVMEVMDPLLKVRQVAQGTEPEGWGTDTRKYLWPLHRNVLNSNRKLEQNKPYSE
jgi:starch-binding outer membrane protein, SusD/RagB family